MNNSLMRYVLRILRLEFNYVDDENATIKLQLPSDISTRYIILYFIQDHV